MIYHLTPVSFVRLKQWTDDHRGRNVQWMVYIIGGESVFFKHNRQVAEFRERGVVLGELSFILNTPALYR